MYYIAYEYTTALGATIRKLVMCETADEYRRVKERITDAEEYGARLLKFDVILAAKEVK